MSTTFDNDNLVGQADYTWYLLTCEDDLTDQAIDQVWNSLQHLRVRDEMLRLIVDVHDNTELWQQIATRLVTIGYSRHANIMCMLAIMAWLDDADDWAYNALHAVLALDPTHSLAGLIHRSIDSGVSRAAWARGVAGMTRETCLGMKEAKS